MSGDKLLNYLKSAVTLNFQNDPIAPLSGLSNEMLCILVAQRAASKTVKGQSFMSEKRILYN